jgi:hypothetical protein
MKRSRRQVIEASAALLAASSMPAQTRQMQGAQTAPEVRTKLQELIGGYRMTQMVYVAAKLGIADHLKTGPLSVKELARLTTTHEDSLYRLLRTLAGLGVFAEEDGPAFRLTPMANLLCSDVPGSLRVSAEVTGEPWMWRPWGHLMHSIKTGEVAFDNLYGKHTWDWFAENPGPAQLFNSLMDEVTGAETRAILAGYNFSVAQKVVDIAGGRGVLLAAVLATNSKARGILFELPHVIQAAKETLDGGIARRIDFVPGDFFKVVPSGGDLYMLKNIIHDWNDAESGKILGVLHQAMAGRGRLLLIEQIICAPNTACLAKSSDMQMMVRNGGRNRTEKEYRDLLAASSFNLSRVVATAGPSIIEAVPA